jgi:hypothetical protein
MTEILKKHRDKIVNGSGIAAIIGTLAVSGLQYHENAALKEVQSATQHALEEMANRYERLVNRCINETPR